MINRFESLAKQWDSKPQRVKGAMIFVDKLKEFLPQDMTNYDVLDYGCGTGLVSFGFANNVKSILGLDSSNAMINIYNEKSKKINMNNINAELHDINIQNLDTNSFDLVVTNMTMHHIKNTNSFIEKLSNSLKNDSYLCIADLKKEDGTFHSNNDGVEHFGFSFDIVKSYFSNNNLDIISSGTLENINKGSNNYEVFYIIGKRI